MQKNKRYYFGKFLNFIKTKSPKTYNFIAGKKGINRIIFDSLVNYYIENKSNIVEEVKTNKKLQEIEPEVTKE